MSHALTSSMDKAVHDFHDHYVKLEQNETKIYEDIALPTVDRIMKYIHRNDPRFSREPLKVGSYWQGLKVEKADEFDFSVILDGPHQCCLETSPERYYCMNTRIGVINKVPWCVDVVPNERHEPLKAPEPSYFFVKYPARKWSTSDDFVREGDIVPYLVNRQLRKLIKKAIVELNVKGDVHPCRKTHGPALTIHLIVDCRNVEVDLAPMIKLQMPFNDPSLSIVWPHEGTQWPSEVTKTKIGKMGVNLVAKKDFYWMESFAEIEGELVKDLPEKRKLVLKVLKKLNTEFWGNNNDPEVSSYILKNIWFWEMEKYPADSSWNYQNIWNRLKNMTNTLLAAIQNRSLSQYFNPSRNLMLEKDPEELEVAENRITQFLTAPATYLKIKEEPRQAPVNNVPAQPNIVEREVIKYIDRLVYVDQPAEDYGQCSDENDGRCPEAERCTNCGDDEHYATYCPHRKVRGCYKCGQTGHKAKFCHFFCANCGDTSTCVNNDGYPLGSP